jgi:HD-GYP domain-containing protein (c-di-GMP phosphodiesterase class II)
MNGSGYPGRLTGKDIILEARILAVADVVEAMASHRPYRPSLGIDKALEEIVQKKGILYDPVVVDACLALFNEDGFNIGQ